MFPQICGECPFARPLFDNRFACGNSLTKVVRDHFPATEDCRDSVLDHPEWYFQPQILTDLQGLDPKWICDHIDLNLNWIDIYPDERQVSDGETAIVVTHQSMKAKLKRKGDEYYSDRVSGLSSQNPYWLALHLVHPDYLYLVVDEILTKRESVPDYI